jgi:hypothetical protein
MNRKSGYWAFGLLALLMLAMGLATWTEHKLGSRHAYMLFYNSGWFSALWFMMAAIALYYIVGRKLYRRLSVAALHLALLLILTGALTTRLTGRMGQIHLRENIPAASFTDERRNDATLPFSLTLKSFNIEYYPGTNSPSNYISIVEINDKEIKKEYEISMNHILNHRGFRFYQASFDEDMHGSVLSINHDTWGIGLSYAGYFLLFFSMLFVLFDRKERFRFLLKKFSVKTLVTVCLFATCFSQAKARDFTPEQCAEWNRVWVEYNGRICPLQTVANDFTVKLTGKDRYRDYSSMQVLLGWLFAPERWQYEPMFEVKSIEMQKLTGRKNGASLSDFIDKNGRNKLEPYYREIYGSKQKGAQLKEVMKMSDRMHLIEMLQDGSLLKIFPVTGSDGRLQWMSPDMRFPAQNDSSEMHFATHFFSLYYECFQQGNDVNASVYLSKLQMFQQKKAGEFLPSSMRLETELLYNRLHLFSWLFKFCLTVGFICLFFFILSTVRNRPYPLAEGIFHILLWVFFAAETFGLGLRTYISGSLPVSNGYETMLLLSWLSLLTGLLVRRYSPLLILLSVLMTYFGVNYILGGRHSYGG